MISKLPSWALWGGAALACVAGMINAVGLLGFQHQGATHLTGLTTLLGVAAANADLAALGGVATIIGAFFAGCALSGVIVRNGALQLGRPYGVALAIECILLLVAVPLLERANIVGACLISTACGLQNGMVSTFSGASLRTTHVTGMFTDLGVFLGHAIIGVPVDARRVKFFTLLVGGFLLGATAGALGYHTWGYRTLYFPAAFTGAVAFAYALFRRRPAA